YGWIRIDGTVTPVSITIKDYAYDATPDTEIAVADMESGTISTYYLDADEDTYGDAASFIEVEGDAPEGYVADNTDCDDSNAAVNPGATEICNTIDDDCNELIDEGLLNTYYADADEDTYGDDAASTAACDTPVGYVADNTDCDDSNAAINPGAIEITNSVDDDCDELIDENVAIQDISNTSATINIYPVPNKGNFTVTINCNNATTQEMLLEIYNTAGVRLYEHTFIPDALSTDKNLHTENYPAGAYILKLSAGDELLVKHFIIE
ncbi:MAG: T9SS type A sorting domain-containing protein, partial [Fimbriimonadaceae bacterium]|nr:T9SS type A sorting domain-containing protein [Chitinophagales bacterium]